MDSTVVFASPKLRLGVWDYTPGASAPSLLMLLAAFRCPKAIYCPAWHGEPEIGNAVDDVDDVERARRPRIRRMSRVRRGCPDRSGIFRADPQASHPRCVIQDSLASMTSPSRIMPPTLLTGGLACQRNLTAQSPTPPPCIKPGQEGHRHCGIPELC